MVTVNWGMLQGGGQRGTVVEIAVPDHLISDVYIPATAVSGPGYHDTSTARIIVRLLRKILELLSPTYQEPWDATIDATGWDEHTIKDLLGQKEIAMAQHYSRDADLRRKMEKLSEIWVGDEAKMRTFLTNFPEKVTNLDDHKKKPSEKSQ